MPISTAEVRILLNAIDKASPVAKSAFATITKDAKNFASGLGVTLERFTNPAMLAGEAVRKIGEYAKQSVVETVAYAEQVRDFSRALGVTAEEASALIQVSDDLVISTDSLQQAMRYAINKGIDISIDGIKNLSEEYNDLRSPLEKAQFAQEKFGRFAGLEMQKLLEASTEQIDEMAQSAQDAGLILSQDAVDAARKYEIAMDNLGDSLQGVKYTIGQQLIPVVNQLAEGLNDHITNVNQTFKAMDKLDQLYKTGAINVAQYVKYQAELRINLDDTSKTTRKLDQIQAEYNQDMSQSNALMTGYNGYIPAMETATLVTDAFGLAAKQTADHIKNEMIPGWEDMQKAAEETSISIDDNINQSLKDMQTIISADITKAKDSFTSDMEEIRLKQEEVNKEIEKYLGLGWSENGEQIQGLRGDYEDLQAQGEEMYAEFETASKKRFLDLVLERAAVDGLSAGELNLIAQMAVDMGLMDQATATAIQGIDKSLEDLNQGAALNEVSAKVSGIYSDLTGMDGFAGHATMEIITTHIEKYGEWSDTGSMTGSHVPDYEGQYGLDMIVPSKYPGDSYRFRASAGERVQITPTSNYNLTINSSARTENLAADFALMQALAR